MKKYKRPIIFFARPVVYKYEPGWKEGDLFERIINRNDMIILEAGPSLRLKNYLIYKKDLRCIMEAKIEEKQDLIQSKMLVCGSLRTIEKWLMDNNF